MQEERKQITGGGKLPLNFVKTRSGNRSVMMYTNSPVCHSFSDLVLRMQTAEHKMAALPWRKNRIKHRNKIIKSLLDQSENIIVNSSSIVDSRCEKVQYRCHYGHRILQISSASLCVLFCEVKFMTCSLVTPAVYLKYSHNAFQRIDSLSPMPQHTTD